SPLSNSTYISFSSVFHPLYRFLTLSNLNNLNNLHVISSKPSITKSTILHTTCTLLLYPLLHCFSILTELNRMEAISNRSYKISPSHTKQLTNDNKWKINKYKLIRLFT